MVSGKYFLRTASRFSACQSGLDELDEGWQDQWEWGLSWTLGDLEIRFAAEL